MKAIEPIARTERQQQIIDDAADLATDVSETSTLIGYMMVCLYSDGTARTAAYRPTPDDHKMGAGLFGAWVKQAIDEHVMFREGVDATNRVLDGEA